MLKCKKTFHHNNETDQESPEPEQEESTENPRNFLTGKQLGFRGLEVLENAESQFPNETKLNCRQNYLS